jgi:hypothetical protein
MIRAVVILGAGKVLGGGASRRGGGGRREGGVDGEEEGLVSGDRVNVCCGGGERRWHCKI